MSLSLGRHPSRAKDQLLDWHGCSQVSMCLQPAFCSGAHLLCSPLCPKEQHRLKNNNTGGHDHAADSKEERGSCWAASATRMSPKRESTILSLTMRGSSGSHLSSLRGTLLTAPECHLFKNNACPLLLWVLHLLVSPTSADAEQTLHFRGCKPAKCTHPECPVSFFLHPRHLSSGGLGKTSLCCNLLSTPASYTRFFHSQVGLILFLAQTKGV